ncbi:MAG: LiaF-related protein [Acidimicrobiia bacterium]|jgi:phage shock protein PspC (stress-responsive transcriptional regulator)
MDGYTTTQSQAAPTPGGQPPWRRPVEGRVFAGVSGAISDRLEIPLWLVRLLFVILAFPGGLGVALYLAGWLLIPRVDQDQSLAQQLLSRIQGGSAWVGVGLIVLALLILSDGIGFLRGDLLLAVILIVVGVLLYRGELGGDRSAAAMTASDGTRAAFTGTGVETAAGTGAGGSGGTPPPVTPSPVPPVQPRRATPPQPRSFLGRLTVGLGLVALGTLGLVEMLTPGLDLGPRHYLGMAIAVLGFGLIVGARFGRARWLIVIGALLIPGLLMSPLADFEYRGAIGDRTFRPATVEEIAPEYVGSIGQLVVDLRGVDLGGRTVELDARLGIGELRVLLPEGVEAAVETSVGMGRVEIEGVSREGAGIDLQRNLEGSGGTVVVDARANVGDVVVRRGGSEPRGTSSGIVAGTRVITSEDAIEDSYEFATGNLVLDLGAVTLTEDRQVDVQLGTGDVTVILPAGQGYDVQASVGSGTIVLPGAYGDGLAITDKAFLDLGGPMLELGIEVGAGTVTVEEGGR